ncbi:MAG: hypothetical protein U9N08_03035 [Candidatus Caldatribacteriota bacterium]|nr:hypothetical protein [Candidatus Caldatribacteriota bacterium]
MIIVDDFSKYYEKYLDSSYDCIDRIVLNAYFPLIQSNGGFRVWWNRFMDENKLDNTHIMRFAGRFSRRIHTVAEKNNIPLIRCQPKERKHEIAEQLIPKDPSFSGVFCILVNRAPAPVYEVKKFQNGNIDIRRKNPKPYVNHYSFHIMDAEWGHITIKFCPHPPFTAQIILNGHEYVAIQAQKKQINFVKEGNCFTNISNAPNLAEIADTMRAPCSVGHLTQVCERWIYSACLCYALDIKEQKQSGFRYSYSIYQVEYSRNLLFKRGSSLEEVFQRTIDRTRSLLDVKTVRTIFGYKHRPHKKCKNQKQPCFEVVLERPVYDMTVFKINYKRLTVKMYSKGERVLRTEVVAHNTKDLQCGKVIEKFPVITEKLKAILEHFLSILHCVDVSFINAATWENWSKPSLVGKSKVSGLNVNQPRIQSVMKAIIAVSVKPKGFTALELAEKIKEQLNNTNFHYTSRQASYDLKKFRGKEIVFLPKGSHYYKVTQDGLKAMAAYITLKDEILIPLLDNACKRKTGPKPPNRCHIDEHYKNIQIEMQKIFEHQGIAA